MDRAAKPAGSRTEHVAMVLIIVSVWIVTCVDKSIWPFGRMVIDIGDMAEQCVPMYTHLWDVLHGQKSLVFDWNTGLGNNMTGAVLHYGLFSPFNLFFLFVKRSAIEASMSVYLLVKLTAIGFSMKFVLRRWFSGLSAGTYISFSLLYVFCAFNMNYYYAIMWLDVAFMFPLVMYGYFLLFNEGKSVPYIICLALTCMMSFQHTYMLFIMLLLLTGIVPLLSKERYRDRLPGLLAATLTAMMISSWIWIPGAVQILQSARKGANFSLIDIYDSIWIFYTAKWMKLLNLGIPLAFFVLYAAGRLKRKDVRFFGFIVTAQCMPICLESTNILWHGGSYEGYTMRFSYMLAFWVLIAGMHALREWQKEKTADIRTKEHGRRISWVAGIAGLAVLTGITAVQYVLLRSDMTVYKKGIPAVVIIGIAGITMVGGGLLLYGGREIMEKTFAVIVIMEIMTLPMTSILIGGEKDSTFFAMCAEAAESAEDYEPITRIKSMDYGLSHNFPLIMHKNAPSCYLGLESNEQLDGVCGLGYAQVGRRMSSYGGTLFTDALLGMKEAVSSKDINESLYQYQDSYKGYGIYKCLYGYDEGIKITAPAKTGGCMEDNPFVRQNQAAQSLIGKEILDITSAQGKEIRLETEGESVVYLYSKQEKDFQAVTVTDTVSGKTHTLDLPSSGWMNGILELGTWKDASLHVEILSDADVDEVSCAVLELQDFAESGPTYFDNVSVKGKSRSLAIWLEGAEENDRLFLPVYRDSGWRCTVNGRRTDIDGFAGFLMEIPLQEGSNEIRLRFVPVGLVPGVCLTLAGIILLAVIGRRAAGRQWKTAGRILFVLDETVFCILVIGFYILPFLFFVKESCRMIFLA